MEFGEQRIGVHLHPPALRAVRRGHPWVFETGIRKLTGEGVSGSLAVLFDAKRQFVGIGIYDPDSPIRVRVLHRGEPITVNVAWLRQAMATCIERRAGLMASVETTACRLVHGENDSLPGIVLDRYERAAVLKLDSAAWLPHLATLTACIAELLAPTHLVLRLSRGLKSAASDLGLADGTMLIGPMLTRPVRFRENGLLFEADLVEGQKTGFFLDQRDNRARVERLSSGRDVLNVCSYTGGFSLYAARGGAKSVTSLDLSAPALAAAREVFALNPELARVPHGTICADAFDGMRELAAQGRRFGLVVLDPPSFARRQADVPQALSAYMRLVSLGLDVLRPGGILVAASCSARVSSEEFYTVVADAAARARRTLVEIERTAHAADHPVGFDEGAYLKCLFAYAN